VKPRISYYISHPIQYFSPLLREMAKEFELAVYYFSDSSIKGGLDKGFGTTVKWDIPLLEGYKYKFIKNYSRKKSVDNKFTDLINPGVIQCLRKDPSPVVIVNGWAYASVLLTIIAAKLMGKKVWLRAENPLNQELRKGRKVLFLKKVFLKYALFKIIDRFLYIGTESRKFFEYYGVEGKRMVFTPYAVDNDSFRESYKSLAPRRSEIRKEFQLSSYDKIILFAGKYIEKKRPMDLLKAFKALDRADVFLVMVGEGNLRRDLEEFSRENGLQRLLLTGFVNQSEIIKYYCVADIFVMCSGMGETWGLSVNEAMNFDLPVVITETCGSSHDLVKPGVNGFRVPEGDIQALCAGLRKLLDDETFRSQAGLASSEIVAAFSIPNIVKHLTEAFHEQYT
jgi:glycosyltransferase involved in cell wall biosynthesis